MKHLFESEPFSVHRGGGAIPIAQAMAGQRLFRLRLPPSRAPENLTVWEKRSLIRLWLRSATLGGITRGRVRALKQGGGSRGMLQGWNAAQAHGGSAGYLTQRGRWISRAAFP